MRYIIALIFLFSIGCAHIPQPRDYCDFTCVNTGAEWRGEVMQDPNGPAPEGELQRLDWCVCAVVETDRTVFFGAPPQNPDLPPRTE